MLQLYSVSWLDSVLICLRFRYLSLSLFLRDINHRQYRHAARYNATHLRRQAYYSLPSEHLDILEGAPFLISRKFRDIDNAIDENADIAEAILIEGLSAFGIDSDDESWKGQATHNDIDKAISTINQLYRDWSADGEPERHASYWPIFNALATYPPSGISTTPHQYNVLVPGAGLGRLVLELCTLGYAVQGTS